MVRFVDLFAGMGGLRTGFQKGFQNEGISTKCVLTSEIKPHAIKALSNNFEHGQFVGDITKIDEKDIPDFDFLLAGFPCQSFSTAGNLKGFNDTRGTLFFDIERILREKKPYGFILENVAHLVMHDKENRNDRVGRTFKIIINSLENLGYNVSWEVLDSKNFGVAQSRRRIFIVGVKKGSVSLTNFPIKKVMFKEIQENVDNVEETTFTKNVLKNLTPEEIYGKSIKDYRTGPKTIKSWDVEARGPVTVKEKEFLDLYNKEYNKTYVINGFRWGRDMGRPLEVIRKFYDNDDLEEILESLVNKKYLSLKNIKVDKSEDKRSKSDVHVFKFRSGNLSFPHTKFIDPNSHTPTLTATDMSRLGVIDDNKLRRLTMNEGLKLFGFEDYDLSGLSENQCYDILGNTVVVNVAESISERVARNYKEEMDDEESKN